MPKRSVKKRRFLFKKFYFILVGFIIIGLLFIYFKNDIKAILGLKHAPTKLEILREKNTAKRNKTILNHHSDKVFGIDVSEYQGNINWNKVVFITENAPINFVFVRATVGKDRVDYSFKRNWEATDKRFIRGAYHYYRPNENSIEQANLFIKTVKLEKADLPPVLDIEKLPSNQSISNLKIGLKRCLDRLEAHYGIKPIIYSGDKYYEEFLKDDFPDYLLWIAHYDFFEDEMNPQWQFWQFTEKAKLQGIRRNVDLNIFNGDIDDLKDLTVN